jgi:cellulose synthase/poly-beta-1,6-N-acetylglucosamine synthase-like glycosyltransferase
VADRAPMRRRPAERDDDRQRFPETDCVRSLLAADIIAAAEDRAAAAGVGADRVLIARGALSEDTYLRALSKALGTSFEPLDGMPRGLCPADDHRLIESAVTGLLPLVDNDVRLVVAPRGTAARRLVRLVEDDPAQAGRFRFTSGERLNRFVLRHAGKAITARASDQLAQRWPMLSAAPNDRRGNRVASVTAGLLALAAAALAPAPTLLLCELMLAMVFLAWLGLRLFCAALHLPEPRPAPAMSDGALPVYTVIAALYREAASVDGLLRAIERLNYPPEKLNVIVAVEAGDHDTRAAIAARASRLPLTVIPVPEGGPRTKPKALNVALPFAHGTFTVIYDAEDRPEPDQLRRALQAFHAGGGDLACVQARLCIDNTADSWLARIFTAEYAGQFDVFLPGLAALRMPLPLGGSSNHFRTAILREVGGWDAYNVTEDADLGVRLVRFGYRSGIVASTTYEEAPAQFGPWLRQRTRWFKGWMQTWRVHMRQPRRLARDLGLPGFIAFQLIVGGNALAALVHPLFMAGLIHAALSGARMWPDQGAVPVLALLYGANIVIGYLTSAALGWIGLMRRGITSTAWVLLLTPAYWLLLSLAAWRALYQLVAAPYAWEKTEHGLAKSSRLAANRLRALLELERYLDQLRERGELPAMSGSITYTSEGRRPRPRASASD